MTDVAIDIYAALKGFAALTALVGGAADPRIYPVGETPQTVTAPYVTYQEISSQPTNLIVGNPDRFQSLIQVDAWANDYKKARELGTEIRLALEAAGTNAYLTDRRDDVDTGPPKLRRHSQDFSVWSSR